MSASRSLRIVKLSAQHHPFDGRMFHLEAKTLRDAGHRVTIIAPNPGDLPADFVEDGIRIKTYRKRGNVLTRKAFTLYTLCRMAAAEDADVFHAHEVDAALFAGAYAKKRFIRRGYPVKLVFDAHEVWPYFYAASTNNLFLRRLAVHGILEYENWMLTRHADLVIAAHVLESYYYRWQNPFISVRIVQTTMEVPDAAPDRGGPIRVIGHEGFFTLQRGMDIILEAFAHLAAENPDAMLQTAGDFLCAKDREWFARWAQRTELGDRVHLTGWVNRTELPELLQQMDVGIVAQREDDHTSRIWPSNKLMNYAAYGIPAVICASVPSARQEVEERDMGRVVPFDAEALYHALNEIIRNPQQARAMGHKAWEHARSEWNWERDRVELLRAYDDLARPTYRPRKTVKLQG